MTTTSIENYLKAIRELRGADERVTTCVLARHLTIAPASVTNMVQRLAADGLLEYTPYRGVALTAAGEREASAVSRRHEIIERYLIGVLGFSDAQAHAEAERLEHVISNDLVSRMETVQAR
jgi:DtxR family Mn-dependent transcriptional regulator